MHPDINADYLGLHLSSPVIIGACALTRRPDYVRELAIAGAGAVVLPSLFQEQIAGDWKQSGLTENSDRRRTAADDADRVQDDFQGGPKSYLRAIGELKHCVGIPIIANLDGYSDGEWLRFALKLQQAGADAIEISFHRDCSKPGTKTEQIEKELIDCVGQVCDLVTIPVSVKLAPYYTDLANLAWRLADAGAAGVVIFAHEPVWETNHQRLTATTTWALTPSGHVQPTIAGLIRVRAGGPRVSAAASGGVSNPTNLIQVIVAGADVVMVTSEIYRRGPDVVAHMLDGTRAYLQRSGFDSFAALTRARPAKAEPLDQRLNRLHSSSRHGCYDDSAPTAGDRSSHRWGHSKQP